MSEEAAPLKDRPRSGVYTALAILTAVFLAAAIYTAYDELERYWDLGKQYRLDPVLESEYVVTEPSHFREVKKIGELEKYKDDPVQQKFADEVVEIKFKDDHHKIYQYIVDNQRMRDNLPGKGTKLDELVPEATTKEKKEAPAPSPPAAAGTEKPPSE